jgi:hypothetical protein
VNEPAGGSVKGQAFAPNIIASFRSGEVIINNNKITNVANPINNQDAATNQEIEKFR